MRCPCCKAAVHESAFHHIDKKTTFIVGETVLKWDLATTALEKQHNPVLARIEVCQEPACPSRVTALRRAPCPMLPVMHSLQPLYVDRQLDEALDFNGNIIFGAIGNACIGCAAWQRCFNVMARWSLTMAAMSQWFAWAPWAFQESIATVHNGKSAHA